MNTSREQHRLIPRPLSVHGVDMTAFRRRFWRQWLKVGLGVMAGGVAGGLLGPLMVGRPYRDDTLWGALTGVAIMIPVVSAMLYAVYRFWQRPVAAGTTVEVWPDRIVQQVVGRAPLVVSRADATLVEFRGGRHRVAIIHGAAGSRRNIILSDILYDYDRIEGCLREWNLSDRPPSEALRSWSAAALNVLALVGLFAVLFCSHPAIVSTAAIVAIVSQVAQFVLRYRRGMWPHMDKVSRYVAVFGLVFGLVVWPLIVIGLAAAKWIKWADIKFP